MPDDHGPKGQRHTEFKVRSTGGTVSITEHAKGATVKCHEHGTEQAVKSWSAAWPVARKPGTWCNQCVGFEKPAEGKSPEEKATWSAEMQAERAAKAQARNAEEIASTRAELESLLARKPELNKTYEAAMAEAGKAKTVEDINRLYNEADRAQNAVVGATIRERKLRAKLEELEGTNA